MKKKILITGVAGFIGSKVAQKFIKAGYIVYGVDDLSSGYKINIPKKVIFIKKDLSKKTTIKYLPKKILGILHLAGQSSGEKSFYEPLEDLQKNTLSTLNLINYSKEMKLQKFLYASSMTVYGDKKKLKLNEKMNCQPLSCYGNSKYISENYLKIYSKYIPYINLRMFNVYGPGQDMKNLKQGMLSIYLAQALNKKKIQIKGSLRRSRDFIYIDDVVDIWFKLFHIKEKNFDINVGSGTAITVKKLVSRIKNFIPGTKSFVKGSTPNDQFYVCSDNKKLIRKLKKFKFTPLTKGLKKFIFFEKKNEYS